MTKSRLIEVRSSIKELTKLEERMKSLSTRYKKFQNEWRYSENKAPITISKDRLRYMIIKTYSEILYSRINNAKAFELKILFNRMINLIEEVKRREKENGETSMHWYVYPIFEIIGNPLNHSLQRFILEAQNELNRISKIKKNDCPYENTTVDFFEWLLGIWIKAEEKANELIKIKGVEKQ